MMELEEYHTLKRKIDSLQRQADKVEGRLEVLHEELKKAGFKTVTEASKALVSSQQQLQRRQRTYDKKVQEFQEKWGDLLK